MSEEARVWFVTGASSGFGRALMQRVLAGGGRVAAAAREPGSVADIVEESGGRGLAVRLDLADAGGIAAAVGAAEAQFGRLDVLVNNAGYGYQATAEEGVDAEIRAVFEVNVFGLFAVTRAVLPGMRARRAGHVVNITSVAGHLGLAGSGFYAASKHAVEGWSDALAAECAPFGVRVTCVAPGPFRTDFGGRSLHQTPTAIAEYAQTAGRRLEAARRTSGTQPGDPVRAADAIVTLVAHPAPPRSIVLGAVGYDNVTKALKGRLAEIEAWREVGVATDFPT